ncbi:hypothetical protein HHK36_003820 [Tetracentron sinense]|uniref:BHLH domain-containing protein n=1 Tax=Tetracentron sinense TaxID=13715 RepID=A0A835DPE4_TETSI|nr:hypothetical protein HHK36_003820 [Tetracentron sinense]
MTDSKKLETAINGVQEVGEENFMESMTVLDFDMLCSMIALQTEGKWRKLEQADEDGREIGGVQRMWEGEVLDCFEDRRIALETPCCPCYRFGNIMRRAGFGSCFIQGTVYFFVAVTALLNYIAFIVSKHHCFLYLAVAFTILAGTYMGFFRTWIRKKFNSRRNIEEVRDSGSVMKKGSSVPACKIMSIFQRNIEEVRDSGSVMKKGSSVPACKRPRIETPSPLPTFKVRKEKLGDRITTLHQLVSPFGKTDTASVLFETTEYIKFLHDQLTNSDKLKDPEEPKQDLRSRGLFLVPVSNFFPVTNVTATDFWMPTFGGPFR